jgi:hypothetical protein
MPCFRLYIAPVQIRPLSQKIDSRRRIFERIFEGNTLVRAKGSLTTKYPFLWVAGEDPARILGFPDQEH